MSYFYFVKSLNELVGDDGLWRLPGYLRDVFISDELRESVIGEAVNNVIGFKNVIITGEPGTGKTALMFMVAKRLFDSGYKIGILKDVGGNISNEHLDEGIVLFYDDLPRADEGTLKAISKNNVKGLIATARVEELNVIKRVMGSYFQNFTVLKIGKMQPDMLRKMLLVYADKEGVKISDGEVIDLIVQKADGLPIYIWQLVREARIRGLTIDDSYAKQIPQGMFDYVDDILWRVLDNHPDRYPILLMLLIITDLKRYAIHQDLYNYLYVLCKEEITENKVSVKETLFSDLLISITRYLAREGKTLTFRLPHDSWADVLRGKSNGPMSAEIALINTRYSNRETRLKILERAIKRAWTETIKNLDDGYRIETFLKNVEENFSTNFVKELKVGDFVLKGDVEVKAKVEDEGWKKVGETAAQKTGVMDTIYESAVRYREKLKDIWEKISDHGKTGLSKMGGFGRFHIGDILFDVVPDLNLDTFRDELNSRGKIAVNELSRVIGDERIAIEILERIGERSPTNIFIYYAKGTIDESLRYVMETLGQGKKIEEIEKELVSNFNLEKSDVSHIINKYVKEGWKIELMKILNNDVYKISDLVKKLRLKRVNPCQLFIDTNGVVIGEYVTGKEMFTSGKVLNYRRKIRNFSYYENAIYDMIQSKVILSKICDLKIAKGRITSISYDPFAGNIYIGDEKGYIYLIYGPKLTTLEAIKAHSKAVKDITVTSERIGTCSEDKKVKILTKDLKPLITLNTGEINRTIHWNEDLNKIAIGGGKTLFIYDAVNFNLIEKIPYSKKVITHVRWSPSGRFLASMNWDGEISIWDGEKHLQVSVIKAFKEALLDMWGKPTYVNFDWHPRFDYLAVYNMGKIQIWSIEKMKIVSELEPRKAINKPHYVIKWHYDGEHLATISKNAINIWSTQVKNEILGIRRVGRTYTLAWDKFRNILIVPKVNQITIYKKI